MNKIEYVKLSDITPAPYNPRKIGPKQALELQDSIKKIGFVVPIIINRSNHVIIAGHQRSKNAKAVGITEVPAYFIDDITIGDEVRFNQMHNGVECKHFKGVTVNADKYEKEQFLQIGCEEFRFNLEGMQMAQVKEICKLMLRYGNVLSAVICRNVVVFAREYVYACKLLHMEVNCYICADEKYPDIVHYFSENYGVYSYESIERSTFVQGLAQLNRSVVKKDGIKANHSHLYVETVLPYLSKHKEVQSILDFGCGKAAYITELKKHYPHAIGLEFFPQNGKSIFVSKGNQMIDSLIAYLEKHKNFDVVVLDSVLNSVDSLKAEKSVMACLNLFTGDRVFISGRTMESAEAYTKLKVRSDVKRNDLYYPDENGFTANFREGKWFFQKFHTKEQVRRLAEDNGFEIVNLYWSANTFRAELKKIKDLPKEEYIEAIDFEFNLPLPNGKSYNRHNDVKKVLGFA